MGLYVILGVPLVGYLWDVLNDVLALHVDGVRLLTAVPVAIVLFFYLKFLAAKLQATFQPPGAG